MIRSLKRKFILISMSLVLVVLLVVFTALCVTTATRQQQSAMRSLESLLMRRDDDSPKLEIGKPNSFDGTTPQRSGNTVGFVLSVDESGTVSITSSNAVMISDDTASTLANIALSAKSDSGLIRSYSLYYQRASESGQTYIAFLDASSNLSAMTELVVTSLLGGALALLAFFFVTLFLSNLALKPVAAAWERQKQFVADASHELKTPLTVILANQKILLSHANHTIASESKWIENTQSEGSRMKSLIEDLLFLAKSDAGKNRETLNEVNLSDVAQGTLLSFASLAFEAGVSLEDDIQSDLKLIGNEPQLRRLFGILLDNAIKYADAKGSVKIHLFADGSNARLSVQNSGAPIPEDELSHLFERFYRADRARSAGGYGLGLSIADSIVRAHGGRISVTSTAAAGTTFTVILPLRASAKRHAGKENLW